MFEPRDRARRKLAARAAGLLDPGTVIRGVFVGSAHARITTPVAAVLTLFAAAFLVALALGTVLIPGGILLALVITSIRPPRVIVVADRGVAVLARSLVSARPSKVVALLPHAALTASHSLGGPGRATVPLGSDRITFSRRERERLFLAMTIVPVAPMDLAR